MGDINSIRVLAETTVEATTGLRWAAGLFIPNWNFRDWNTNLYGSSSSVKSLTGEDGNPWDQTGFRDWFCRDGGNGYNHAFGTAGIQKATGYYDESAIYIEATLGTATIDIENSNQVMETEIFTGHIPFNPPFTSHYSKALSMAIVLDASDHPSSTWDIGTHLRAFVAQYDSSHTYLAYDELVWEDDGDEIPTTWGRLLAHTETAMHASTAYVQLYIGIKGDAVNELSMNIDMVSLMINPTNADLATGTPDYFVDLDTVFLSTPPSDFHDEPGITDQRMEDGHLVRVNTMKGGPFRQLGLAWYKEDPATAQKLILAHRMSTKGLGITVPEPVPICADIGMGQMFPFFGYYHATGGLAVPMNTFWTSGAVASGAGGYDINLNLVEV